MSREWKPKAGDVGISIRHGYRGIYVEACRVDEHDRHGGPCWHNESGFSDPPVDNTRRPLVVIDPEDRGQAHRLIDLYLNLLDAMETEMPSLRMQAALRAFADPKPEEPTNWLAAVIDTNGSRWSRTFTAQWPWERENAGDVARWDEIDVVRVLSEGIS